MKCPALPPMKPPWPQQQHHHHLDVDDLLIPPFPSHRDDDGVDVMAVAWIKKVVN